MKMNGKFKAMMMSLALIGMMIATPMVTNAAQSNKESSSQLLHKGMQNTDVKPVQHQLKEWHYYHFDVDGIYGPLTFRAVKDFQKDHGLSVDGIVGPKTKQAMKKMKSLKHTYQHAPTLKQGSHGKIVKDLQKQLQQLNYYDGKLDGIYGPLTEKAVKAFQKANEIAVDGIVGPDTYAALIQNPVLASSSNPSSRKTVVESVSTGLDHSMEKKDSRSTVKKDVSRTTDQGNVKTFYVESTAYTAHCAGCSGITATGINLLQNPGARVIAVDPDVIPLGSTVWVEGYGYAVAGDTGGAINGRRIDVFIPSQSKAMHWGRRTVKIKVFE
ncbi:MAG TPA: peptidoglycan-binding protein [Bacillales bacterium]|nr:peptidoglycan-binding protein [Bacillales bacterium]